jgi:hypothetical protein
VRCLGIPEAIDAFSERYEGLRETRSEEQAVYMGSRRITDASGDYPG